jgi:hypothetical protein
MLVPGDTCLKCELNLPCIPKARTVPSLCRTWEEPYAIPIRYANELGSAALGEYRDRIAQKRLWNSRERRRHGWIRNLVKRQYRVQLSRFRRLQRQGRRDRTEGGARRKRQ